MPPVLRPAAARRTDLDLLRVAVCFSVILAHALLIFAAEPRYHVKSATPWLPASIGYEFMRIATLAIFFALAGWSAVASLRRRAWGRYVRDRLWRVLLPLVAGVVLLGPVIKWIELGQGRDLRINGFRLVDPPTIGFLEFLPRYLSRLQLVTWSHLWFLAYLFLISLVLLPLLLRLARRPPSAAVPGRVLAFVPAALLGLYLAASRGYWPFLPNLLQDWANLGYFALCFAAGAGFAAWPGYEARLRAEAPWLALLAGLGFGIVIAAGEFDARAFRGRALRLGLHRRRPRLCRAAPAGAQPVAGLAGGGDHAGLCAAPYPGAGARRAAAAARLAGMADRAGGDRRGDGAVAGRLPAAGAALALAAPAGGHGRPAAGRGRAGLTSGVHHPGAASPAQRKGRISATARSKSPLSQAPPDIASSRPVRSRV